MSLTLADIRDVSGPRVFIVPVMRAKGNEFLIRQGRRCRRAPTTFRDQLVILNSKKTESEPMLLSTGKGLNNGDTKTRQTKKACRTF